MDGYNLLKLVAATKNIIMKQSISSLEDELETLRLYLDMEKLKLKNSFEYTFNLSEYIEVENIFVPPFLPQPFAENAIWHGLMHKRGKGL